MSYAIIALRWWYNMGDQCFSLNFILHRLWNKFFQLIWITLEDWFLGCQPVLAPYVDWENCIQISFLVGFEPAVFGSGVLRTTLRPLNFHGARCAGWSCSACPSVFLNKMSCSLLSKNKLMNLKSSSVDLNQTALMCRLIWIYTGGTKDQTVW
jgi:hypothetical protein